MVDGVILAGGTNIELGKDQGVRNKALIKIKGKEIIRYILEAFSAVEELGRLAVVGPVDDLAFLQDDYRVELIPEGDSILQNILKAQGHLQSRNPLLISSSDIPLLTPEAVSDFLKQCFPYDYDFYYPIVRKEDSEKKIPGAKRTYVKLKEGCFTGGNIFLINPEKLEASVPMARKFIDSRKNPLKMVSLLGPSFLLLALTGRVSISQVERRFSALLNVKAKAIISEFAEISFDVDKPVHMELVHQML